MNALVVLVDIFRNRVTSSFIQSKFFALVSLIRSLPYSEKQIKAGLHDARSLPIGNDSVDFVITSPPIINVFNYHQNYRRSVEVLGWDVLRVARSEIGSNRANRGNRFYTVVQYCIDMANAIREIARVQKPGGRAVFIVGYESNVLGTQFYNADIIEQIAFSSGLFDVALRQKRVFSNRFGQAIREDILNLERTSNREHDALPTEIGRAIALNAMEDAKTRVPEKNRRFIEAAVRKVRELDGTPFLNSFSCAKYQTRDSVMIDKIKSVLDDTDPQIGSVLEQGHF